MQLKRHAENDVYITNVRMIAAAVLLPACIMLSVESLARGSVKFALIWILKKPVTAFINYVVWFVPFNIFQFIRRRWIFWTCQLMLTVVAVCMGMGNAAKLQTRTTPFVFQDLSVLDAALAMAEEYFPNWNVPRLIVCIMLFVVVFAIIAGSFFNRYVVGKARWFLVGSVCCCIVFYAALNGAFWLEGYSLKNNYESNGFANGLLHSTADSYMFEKKPQGYSRLSVENAIKNAVITPVSPTELYPNVIVVLGEAFMDTDMLSTIDFNSDPIPTLHRVMQEYASGYVTVDVQGGGTCFSEAEVLTGIKNCNYSVLASKRRNLPSLASIFNAYGYSTHALHTYHGWFYNRYDVMDLMGFDEFICQNTFLRAVPPVYGTWNRDSLLYDETLDVIKATTGPDFCYLATMETHGAYNYDMEDGDWFTNDFSIESKRQLNTYFNLLSDADRAIGDFLDKLSTIDEPTVVLFFGDHIPSLGEKAYQEVAFDTTSSESFMTPYFIWNNYGLVVEDADMPIQRLGAYTLMQLGLNEDPYLSLIASMPDNNETMQIAADLIAYDLLYGEQYYLEITHQDFSDHSYRIGHEIELEDVDVFQLGERLFIAPKGRNLPASSKVVINGDVYSLSNDGFGWSAVISVGDLPIEKKELEIHVRVEDSKGTVVSKSNEILVPIDLEAAKENGKDGYQYLMGSLSIDSIYPGTEITQEILKADGSLDIGVSSQEISTTTSIYADGEELTTFYGDTFISATIPAEMMLDGKVELRLFNRILDRSSDLVVLKIRENKDIE